MGISISLPRGLRLPWRGPGSPPTKLFVVPHTHWDREWYLPFEEFRARLVETVDGLLDLLARDPRFSHFTLDGQTVILDDYLEARPERREEIRRLVESGRVLVGPWYVMPDEFLVSAESLVRNLQRGIAAADDLGGAMRVGYVPDTFGHVAQLPQILRGFGIDAAVLWRGVGPEVRQNEFRWRAPNGSEVLALHLRGSYANAERLPTEPDELLDRLDVLRRELEPTAASNHLLLMNGGDHAAPQPELPDLLRAANRRLRDATLVLGTIPAYLASFRASTDVGDLEVVSGELRSPARAHLLVGVLSTRLWIKQRNAAAQSLLEKWAEPFAVFAGQPDSARPLLRLAWRYLLLCHPHDSICGCSIDQVHEEMRVRFDRVEQLGGRVVSSALQTLAARIDTQAAIRPPDAHPGAEARYLAVFNPIGGTRDDFVSLEVAPPSADFRLADSAGAPVPCQVLAREADDALAVTIPRAHVETYLRLAGNAEGWRLRMIERGVTALARVAAPALVGLVIVGHSFRGARKPGLVEVEIQTASTGAHDYDALGRLVRELRSRIGQAGISAVRFHILKPERVRIGFVARGLPGHGYRLYQMLAAESAEKAETESRGASLTWLFGRRRESDSRTPTLSQRDGQDGSAAAHVAGVQAEPALSEAERGHNTSILAASEAATDTSTPPADAVTADDALTPSLSQRERDELLVVPPSRVGKGDRGLGPSLSPDAWTDSHQEGGQGVRSAPEIVNEYFAVRADPRDGTLVVEDRLTGGTYTRLGAFVDSGDAGDEYNHAPPTADLFVDRPAALPTIRLLEAGPVRRRLRIDQTYLVPSSLDDDRESRSTERVPLSITTVVTLVAGVRRIDLTTTVENAARDHLLRVRFPTGAEARVSRSEGHFAVIERPIAVPPPRPDWPESPTATIPHSGFVEVSDGKRGLLLAAPGLPEVAVCPPEVDGEGSVVYLTLLRAVGWLSRDDLPTRQGAAGPVVPTPGAQCLGRHVYRYSLVPHAGPWEDVAHLARAFAAPLRAVSVEDHSGDLPPERSFLSLERVTSTPESEPSRTQVVVSAVKTAEDGEGVVVRLNNPTASDEVVRLHVAWPLARAVRCDLEERGLGEIALDDERPHPNPLPEGEGDSSPLPFREGGQGVRSVSVPQSVESAAESVDSLTLPIRGYEVVSLRLIPS